MTNQRNRATELRVWEKLIEALWTITVYLERVKDQKEGKWVLERSFTASSLVERTWIRYGSSPNLA